MKNPSIDQCFNFTWSLLFGQIFLFDSTDRNLLLCIGINRGLVGIGNDTPIMYTWLMCGVIDVHCAEHNRIKDEKLRGHNVYNYIIFKLVVCKIQHRLCVKNASFLSDYFVVYILRNIFPSVVLNRSSKHL